MNDTSSLMGSIICLQALQDAEKRAAIEAALKEANQARQEELEESLTLLEGLLEEEKQAKRDEEIVRGLQAR